MRSFDELYDKYYSDVFRFLMKLCSYHQDTAEELTQETFFHTYLQITKFKGDCHVKTWILQIAKNRYFMYMRKNKNTEISISDALPYLSEMTDLDLDDKLFRKKLIQDSLNIIFGFQENMKYVVLNRIYCNMPYFEIAKRLGISQSSAKVLYHRGKLLLREKLKEEYGYEI